MSLYRSLRRLETKRLNHEWYELRNGRLDISRVQLEKQHYNQWALGEYFERFRRARQYA